MKILTIVGARPQFVKAAAFSRKLKELTDWEEIIVHTGQHFDENMSEIFFREMEIPKPDYNLAVNSLSHAAMTGRMLERIEEILLREKPDLVLVYGDTNSTLAGALAAKKLHIKTAHVEAGLRSFDERMPEEINRILTDRLSDYLFVPGANASRLLKKEGVPADRIFEVGDIMHDAVKFYSTLSSAQSSITDPLPEKYVLLTFHRQENIDDPKVLAALVQGINTLCAKIKVVFPIHPRTRKKLTESGHFVKARLLDPVGYFDMLELIKSSQLVLTDSGGLQKEAFYLGKFCITLRQSTEWTELVEIGANKICGSDKKKLIQAFDSFVSQKFPRNRSPYGKGDTAEKIIEVLKKG